MKILKRVEAIDIIQQQRNPFWSTYKAMYSSWLGGIVCDPDLMIIPMDDHLVHRGDGVFEAIKARHGKLWLASAHYQRLLASADKIELQHNYDEAKLNLVCEKVLEASQLKDALIRVFLSRGPGAFSTNPYDSLGAQLYVVATEYNPPSEEKYRQGVRLGVSKIPPKESWLAQIKTCNYLPNVLMKKEAVDMGYDFVIGVDSQGYVTESSTENIIIVDHKMRLRRPALKGILKGTTMMRVMDLAQNLVNSGELTAVVEEPFTVDDLCRAQEVMMVGTTLDVLPVSEFEGVRFNSHTLSEKLRGLLLRDQF